MKSARLTMNRFPSLMLSALAVGLMTCQVAVAATYYVHPVWGSDSNNGSTPCTGPGVGQAVQTITKAGQLAGAGDTVRLQATGNATGHYLDLGRLNRDCLFGSAFSGTSDTIRVVVETDPNDVSAGRLATFDPGYAEFKSNPNTAWVPCTESGAAADEYVSVNTYDMVGNNSVWGCFLKTDGTSGDRLLTYARIEDLRASNQSFAKVPLSDPRPSGGPLVANPNTPEDDTQFKFPWCYRGPGIWWDDRPTINGITNPNYKKIHFRAAPTSFNQPGVIDYSGESDPRDLSLSIALSGHYAFAVTGDYITFKNIVVQNGGESSGRAIGSGSSNYCERVTFDHCTFNTSRNGFLTGWTKFLKFSHCVFDGNLASYVSRQDVKTSYDFTGPSGTETNGCCRMTQACLLGNATNNEDMDIGNCEFRNGHDGVQLWGVRSKIHHSLLENLNDEAIMFYGAMAATDTQVYNNVVRKVMQAFSSSEGSTGSTGIRYVYRNIVDMRVPIMGTRDLPPDPVNIWRAGEDYKFNMPVPEIYSYHNTFVLPPIADGSGNECSDAWGNISTGAYPTPKPRQFKNNILMAIHADRPLYTVPDPAFTQLESDGNVWCRRVSSPFTHLFNSYDGSKYSTWSAMNAAFPLWEAAGQNLIAYPQFAGVGDYVPTDGGTFLNADYRLKSGSPARYTGSGTGGINLNGTGWPGTSGSPANPDCGAIAYGGSAFTVGVDSRFSFPDAVTPIAEAGDFSVVSDTGNNGFETITFDGTGSNDPNGSITAYSWKLNGSTILSASTGSVGLPVGTHRVFMTVTDNQGKTATDMREVTIDGFDNLVKNPGFEDGDTSWTVGPGCSVVTSQLHLGAKSLQLLASTTERITSQIVPITPGQTVSVSGWAKKNTAGGIYFRLKYDWLDSNGVVTGTGGTIATHNSTTWTLLSGTTSVAPAAAVSVRIKACLDAGSHTAWFDDAHVLIVNKVKNAHFEQGSLKWTFTGSGSAAASVTSDPAHVRSGTQCAVVTDPTGAVYIWSEPFPVVQGTGYTISAWSRGVNASVGAQLRVRWLNSSGGVISTPQVSTSWGTGTTAYTRKSAVMTAPSGAVSAIVELRRASGTGTVYFDDVWVP